MPPVRTQDRPRQDPVSCQLCRTKKVRRVYNTLESTRLPRHQLSIQRANHSCHLLEKA